MSRKPYPNYKPSGVPWLGEIPSHWEVIKIKYLSTVQFSNVDKLSNENELPVLLCNYSDVYNNDFVTSETNFMTATATDAEIKKFTIQKGDILLTKDSESWNDIAIPAYIMDELANVLCGYHLAQIRSDSNIMNNKFLFRLFLSKPINYQFQIAATGVIRFGLGNYWLNSGLLTVPPTAEQQKIADYLDAETSKIDGLVEKKKRQIELLKEKRSAVISRAVTRGLDPSAPLKPSGIPWLGDIPSHWEAKRLRFFCLLNPVKSEIRSLAENDNVSFLPMEAISEYGGIKLEQTRAFIDVKNGFTYFKNGDVVVAKITPCFENGKGSIVSNLENGIGFGTTELHVLRSKKDTDLKYLFYLTIADPFRKIGAADMYGAGGQKRISEEFILNFRFPQPSMIEQQQIADYLDNETSKSDRLIAKIESSIELLKEYRSSLISACVTGRIDVRDGEAAQ